MKTLIAVLAMVGALTAWAPMIHAQQYPADNSGKNVRDRKAGAPTSGDQSNAKSDVAITQEIRKAAMADKSLSTNAHNVKIIRSLPRTA
jgi:hyperosmotically inducible protein